MTNDSPATPDDARAVLDDVSRAAEGLARRIRSPWWYRTGQALSVFAIFTGMSLVLGAGDGSAGDDSMGNALILVGAAVVPTALLTFLKERTGMSVERYSNRPFAWWTVACFMLLGLGALLQLAFDVPYALVALGVVAAALTVALERSVDSLLRERVRNRHVRDQHAQNQHVQNRPVRDDSTGGSR